MSNRKQRKDIDKAIKNIMNYAEQQEEWKLRLGEIFKEVMSFATEELDIEADILLEDAHDGGYWNLVFGYIFELFATTTWHDEEQSFLDDYLKRRGWREAPVSRRYLKAMNESEVDLWELTTVKPGFYADVRRFGTDDKPIRVIEKAATEQLQQWDSLAGRVVKLDGVNLFTGALLPIPRTEINNIQVAIDKNKIETRAIFDELLADGEIDALPDDLEQAVADNVNQNFSEILFTVWITYLYKALNHDMPSMLSNKDGDVFQFTKVVFPLKASSKKITQALNDIPDLDKHDDKEVWTWLPCKAEELEEGEFISALGFLFLKESSLELEVNSKERAERGSQWLKEKLSKLVGKPLTLHENIQSSMDSAEFINDEPAKNAPTRNSNEEQALMSAYMDKHYLQTLDDPIPMLNDNTPRECAANPKTHKDVVNWLKYMENQSAKDPSQNYDFSWIWKELGLEKYKR